MAEISELERRITAALDRIGTGLDGIGGADEAELAGLREALEAEKTTNAQLEERVKALHDQQTQAEEQMKAMEAQADTLKMAAVEAKSQVQQLRKTNQHLQATLQNLREASTGDVEPHMINQAMMSELEGLRSVRDADRAELDEILGALQPLLKETQDA